MSKSLQKVYNRLIPKHSLSLSNINKEHQKYFTRRSLLANQGYIFLYKIILFIKNLFFVFILNGISKKMYIFEILKI